MNVDEILGDTNAAMNLPSGAVPLHIIVVIDFALPETGQRCLAALADEALPHWCIPGMLEGASTLVFEPDDPQP